MEYQIGQVVYSKSGHDKGGMMMILSLEGPYAYLADGRRRKLERPKKKKLIHIQPTGYVDAELAGKLCRNEYVLDADIAKALKSYQEKLAEK
ncbi:KOW domain-containing RNA-binding protein [Anaerotignum lactatifermentans]|nr:KOW domain-containing RNA-binding protein [Anaerotignum lactatifermentans]MBM6829392.1 KOW domain-containing RNA-binding protein [Anaerotignum lactatifermentans]MBM6950969.1 KOW domain-containing RNA-binding protein [Anaerotignum lactatifermentans]